MAITVDTEPNRTRTTPATGDARPRTTDANHPPNHLRTTDANHPRTTPANHPDEPAAVTLPAGWLFALLLALATGLTIAGAAFKFSFTNVEHLGIDLGIAKDVAPWIAPTVDLSIVGMAVSVQWLALAGVAEERLKAFHGWLIFSGALTLALNSAPAFIAGYTGSDARAYGRGLVESVAPVMLIGWTYFLPRLVQMFVELRTRQGAAKDAAERREAAEAAELKRAAAADAAELERLSAESKATAARLAAEVAAEARRAELTDQAAARQLEADLATTRAKAEADVARARADADANLELRRLELAARERERIAAERAVVQQREADLERERLATERATAEAEAAWKSAAAAAAQQAAAEAARAAAEARTTARTTSEQRRRTEPANGTASRKTRTEPANRIDEPPTDDDNVVKISAGTDLTLGHLATLYGSLTAADNVRGWDDVWTEADGFRIGVNELHRRTGIRKATLYKIIKHAHDLYPWPGDPVEPAGEATTG